MARVNCKRLARIGLMLLCAAALLLGTFALPIRSWRTGEITLEDFPASPSEAEVPARVWIDTDAACGQGRRSDPDDCLAILNIARSQTVEIAGISTVYGNADLAVTDRTTRALAARLAKSGWASPGVARGASERMDEGEAARTEAASALTDALEDGQTTILELGPLTNIAAVLRAEPSLVARVDGIIAVMGHRPGHLFHPSEGIGSGILFGHGPVFSDLNFRKDPEAVRFLLSSGVPVTLIPYEVAREVMVTPENLAGLAASDPVGAWIAQGAAGWMEFWQEEIGLNGFYPFDLVAARYLLTPDAFLCGAATARVATGWAPDWLWVFDSAGLLVTPQDVEAKTRTDVTYCPNAHKSIGDMASDGSARAPL